jgi:TRAP-type mannitol/chloroaromatic compound transport system permease large subunit
MGQFMILQLIGLALCIIFPEISLWFPRYLFGK